MKKIVIVSLYGTLYSGVESVGLSLANQFAKDGHKVSFISLYKLAEKQANLDFDARVKVAALDIPTSPLILRKIIGRLKMEMLMKQYGKAHPDSIVIFLNPQCMRYNKYFKNATIFCQWHNNFETLDLKNNWILEVMKKKRDEVASFVWLTQDDCEKAKNVGLKNSTYIYNPCRIEESQAPVYLNKKVISLGNLAPVKQVNQIIAAFEKANVPEWELHIFGSGSELDSLQDYINTHKLEEKVFLRGAISDVKSAYEEGSVFIMASQFEGLPLSRIEAGRCGLPTVTYSDADSITEIIDTGITGFIVENGNLEGLSEKLSLLMLDDKLREEMSAKVKFSMRKFDSEVIAAKWYELFYDEL